MSECIKSFKEAFRQSQWYKEMHGMRGMSDLEIFERANSERTFYKIQTNDAWRIWRLSALRAAKIAIRATEIPADAKSPTRDRIVEAGESIRDLILHAMCPMPALDRKKFESLFKETQEFRKLMELCWGRPESVFKIDPTTEGYAISSVQAAWECFEAEAQ